MNKYVTTWEANTQNSGIKLWDEVGRIRVLHFLMQNANWGNMLETNDIDINEKISKKDFH